MLRKVRGHSYFISVGLSKDKPIKTIRVYIKDTAMYINHEITIRGGYYGINTAGVMKYNITRINGEKRNNLLYSTFPHTSFALEPKFYDESVTYVDYILGFKAIYHDASENMKVEINDSSLDPMITHVEIVDGGSLINNECPMNVNALQYNQSNVIDLLGAVWVDPKLYNNYINSRGYFKTVTLPKLANVKNTYDYLLITGSDSLLEEMETDISTVSKYPKYPTEDTLSSMLLPLFSNSTQQSFSVLAIDANNTGSDTSIWGLINFSTNTISIARMNVGNTLGDPNCGIYIWGVKKNSNHQISKHNIKPPYNINKVVNIYHISPQTKGGDNMLRKITNLNFKYNNTYELSNDEMSDVLNNLNFFAYLNSTSCPLFGIIDSYKFTIKSDMNVVITRLSRNIISIKLRGTLKTVSSVNIENPFYSGWCDSSVVIGWNLSKTIKTLKIPSLGIIQFINSKLISASGSIEMPDHVYNFDTPHIDLPNCWYDDQILYISDFERTILDLVQPQLASTKKTVSDMGYYIVDLNYILKLTDSSFTQESLDWFDMTEKKRNLINILNISPLNYNKYKEVS